MLQASDPGGPPPRAEGRGFAGEGRSSAGAGRTSSSAPRPEWQRTAREEPQPGPEFAAARQEPADAASARALPASVRIYPYGVSRSRLERAIYELKVPASIAKSWQDADAVIALKAHYRREPGRLRDAIDQNKPTFVVRSNTQVQIESILRQMFHQASTEEAVAMQEAEEAIERVMETGEPVDLMPQNAYVRRLQHQLIESYNLTSASIGSEPYRRIRITKG